MHTTQADTCDQGDYTKDHSCFRNRESLLSLFLLFSAAIRNRYGDLIDQWSYHITNDNCVADGISRASEDTEYTAQDTDQNTIKQLTGGCYRTGYGIGCHKEGCHDHTAACQMCQQEIQIESLSAEQYDKCGKAYQDRCRDLKGDATHCPQNHTADK